MQAIPGSQVTKGARTQEQILEVTISLFSKHGFHDTSFQKIADRCRLSQAAILKHYPSKKALFFGVIQKILKTNHEFVESRRSIEKSGKAALIEHFENNILWAKQWPAQASNILLLYYLSSLEKDFTIFYQQVLKVGRERLLKYGHEGVNAGDFAIPRDELETTAQSVHEALIGIMLNLIATQAIESPSQIKQALAKLETLVDRAFEVPRSKRRKL